MSNIPSNLFKKIIISIFYNLEVHLEGTHIIDGKKFRNASKSKALTILLSELSFHNYLVNFLPFLVI